MYQSAFGNRVKPRNTPIRLQVASGAFLRVKGESYVHFDISGRKYPHRCVVVDGLNRDIIIGRDFMKKYNVVLSMGSDTCQIGDMTISMLPYKQVNSIIRLSETIEVPPRHLMTTTGRYHRRAGLAHGSIITWQQAEHSFINNEPGLMVVNGVGRAGEGRRVPLTIVNKTGRHFRLKKGNVVAMVSSVESVVECNSVGEMTSEFAEAPEYVPVVDNENLPEEQKEKLNKLLQKNSDIFAKNEFDLGKTNLLKASIDTGNSPPVQKRPYRTPFAYRDELKRQLNEMLQAGIVSPSNSNYSAPIIMVKKKCGSLRLCVDFRDLNAVTKKFAWPLPNIDDIFASLGGTKYFSSLDFLKGYHQIPLEDSSKEKTAFVTENALYEYNYLPFGLNCAPSWFQKCMSKLLNGLTNCIAYLDDIIIYSKSFDGHLEDLQNVFHRIRNAGMKLKGSKCDFLKDRLNYLGHVLTTDGNLEVDPEKIKVIQGLKPPKTVREVRAFVGTTSYYRKFIQNFSAIAEPLTSLTRKNAKFIWSEKHEIAFETLKKALMEAPILHLPSLNEPFQLFTDACDRSIGALLTQEVDGVYKPVYYLSHHLSDSQQRWPIIEKECYAIVFAIEKFRHFLEGKDFKIFSDHNPLKYIQSTENKNAKLQRWAIKISAFGGRIEFIKGKLNVQADFLSRLDPSCIPKYSDTEEVIDRICELSLINTDQITKDSIEDDVMDAEPADSDPTETPIPFDSHKFDIKRLQKEDKKIQNIVQSILDKKERSKYFKKYLITDDILYHVTRDEELRLVIPKTIQQSIVKETHEGTLGQHIGRDRTFETIRQRYYWQGMASDVYEYIGKCIICNQQNLRIDASPLQDTPIADFPFQRIGIDTTGPYPVTEGGNKFCLTVTDHFSGWIECFPIPDKRATTIAKHLVDDVFRRFSWCRYMTSDNGSEFVNDVLRQLTKLGHVHHITTSVYHPRANGRAERPHRTMVACLAKVSNKVDWDAYIPSFCAAYNFSVAGNVKFSPFYLLYHRDPMLPLDTIIRESDKYEGDDFLPNALQRMHTAYELVRKRIKKTAEKSREYANQKRNAKPSEIKVGDPVYWFNHRRQDKFDKKWVPHYRVLKQTGPVSFIVQNQLTGKEARVHAEDLRLARGIDKWKPEENETNIVTDESDTDAESDHSEEEYQTYQSSDRENSESSDVEQPSTSRPTRQAKETAKLKLKYCDAVAQDELPVEIRKYLARALQTAVDTLQG